MKNIQILLLCLLVSSSTFAQEQILGKWLTQNKDAIVEIYKEKDKYNGKIIKLIPAKQEDGSAIID